MVSSTEEDIFVRLYERLVENATRNDISKDGVRTRNRGCATTEKNDHEEWPTQTKKIKESEEAGTGNMWETMEDNEHSGLKKQIAGIIVL